MTSAFKLVGIPGQPYYFLHIFVVVLGSVGGGGACVGHGGLACFCDTFVSLAIV